MQIRGLIRRPVSGLKQPSAALSEFSGLMNFINADDKNKADVLVEGGKIEFTDRKTLAIPTKNGTKEYGFSPWSFDQFASMLHIPSRYLSSCPVTGKGGMKDQIEARMEKRVKKDHLIRLRNTDTDDGIAGTIRAVLPGNYAVFDNRNLVIAVSRAIREIGLTGFKIVMHNAADPKSVDKSLHLRIIKNASFDISLGERGDPHQVGFHCRTSEIGAEDICLDALVYRIVCTNGLMGFDGSEVLRMKHKNFQAHEITPLMQEGVLSAIRQEEPVKEMLERKLAEPLSNPEIELQLMAGKMRVSDGVISSAADVLRREIRKGEEATRFLLMQAFTEAAQSLSMQERIKLEETVGRYALGGGLRRRKETVVDDIDENAVDADAN